MNMMVASTDSPSGGGKFRKKSDDPTMLFPQSPICVLIITTYCKKDSCCTYINVVSCNAETHQLTIYTIALSVYWFTNLTFHHSINTGFNPYPFSKGINQGASRGQLIFDT